MSEDDFIKFSNVDIDGGVTTVTFQIPTALFNEFNELLGSLLSIFKFSQRRSRHVQAQQNIKNQQIQDMYRQQFEILKSQVLQEFDRQALLSSSLRDTFRQTKLQLAKRGHHITSYQIELICRNSGRLSSKKGSHG